LVDIREEILYPQIQCVTTGSVREEPEAEHHLHVEKAHDSLRSYLTVVLGPRVGYPLRRDTNED
jgi:hypothetical protein